MNMFMKYEKYEKADFKAMSQGMCFQRHNNSQFPYRHLRSLNEKLFDKSVWDGIIIQINWLLKAVFCVGISNTSHHHHHYDHQ